MRSTALLLPIATMLLTVAMSRIFNVEDAVELIAETQKSLGVMFFPFSLMFITFVSACAVSFFQWFKKPSWDGFSQWVACNFAAFCFPLVLLGRLTDAGLNYGVGVGLVLLILGWALHQRHKRHKDAPAWSLPATLGFVLIGLTMISVAKDAEHIIARLMGF